MARKKQNPIDDLAKNVGGWLGGAARTFADLTDSSRDNAPREKGTQKFIEGSRMIGRTADALTGGFGSAALKDARKGSSVPSNLLKTAAVNLAAGGVAYGAAKTAGAAVRSGRVVNPAAAARNLAKGEKVVVHGTPHQLQGKFIEPRAESWGAQDVGKPIAYYFDPRATNAKNKLPRGVQEYSNPSLYFNPDLKSRMNAVIGTTPKSATKVHKTTGYSYSEAPISIQKVVKTNKSPEQLGKELQRELRKLGTQMRGEPMVDKVKTALIRHQNKKMRNWRQ